MKEGTYYIHVEYHKCAGKYTLRYDVKSHTHSLIEVPGEAATENSDGFRKYYECSCRRMFSDEKGLEEISAPQVIPKIVTVKLANSESVYTGKRKSTSVIVKDRTGKKIDASCYDITVPAGRINAGEYSYKVKFKGDYRGAKVLHLKINPKGTTQYAPTARSKGFTVKWKKQAQKMATSRITGYQIRYSVSSAMTSSKYVSVRGYRLTSKKISKLKSRKKYYVQVRTYKTVNGKNYYSSWSARKSVITK